jgi:prolyl-tRNA synthetase
MKLTEYFLPVLKEIPAEAKIVSHRLMLRSGMIKQAAAGIYSWLPLGLRVLDKIEGIVHNEQIKAGHIPILMPTIQPSELWKESGRYDDYGKEMLRIVDRQGRSYLYGPTNEELITDIFRSYINSYKDLPKTFYHIQWKFRDELRPRFGIMRGREFFMKDGYNFDLNKEDAITAYNRHMVSYLKTFKKMGLQAIPMKAETGPIGGDHSHEFLVLANTGESSVYFDKDLLLRDISDEQVNYNDREGLQTIVDKFTSSYARTEDTHEKKLFAELPDERRYKGKAIEVGQIFYFGTKYSKPMNAFVTNSEGEKVAVEMGSHGIGVSRLVGAIIEASHDDKGIIWPDTVAPFFLGIINLNVRDDKCNRVCEELYKKLTDLKLEILYDDTEERPGVKFARMDLIGLPWKLIVGPKGLDKNLVELINRKSGELQMISPENVLDQINKIYNETFN